MPTWHFWSFSATASTNLALLFLLTLRLSTYAPAQCVARLPTVDNPSNGTSLNGTDTTAQPSARLQHETHLRQSSRVINGLEPSDADYENIVTIAQEAGVRASYICTGSLIAPNWVLTAAQCFVTPRDGYILVGGGHSLAGTRFEILRMYTPHAWSNQNQGADRGDIQLIELREPVTQANPSPAASTSQPTSSQESDSTTTSSQDTSPSSSPSPPSVAPSKLNFMYINTNREFAIPPAPARYLRLKGYGMNSRPGETDEGLIGRRPLRFADIKTTPCGGQIGSNGGRRICTAPDRKCGPCFGDTGGPLYDVDSSGEAGVLVGILTFGTNNAAFDQVNPVCVNNQPVQYTAVAPYVDWIKATVGNSSSTRFYQLPPNGITNTRLAPERDSFPIGARISLIAISSVALIAALTALFVTCTLKYLRRRRRRWVEGLHAEDSFVKAGEKHAAILDPFEGITDDQRHARPSIGGIPRAALTGATEFSVRSMQKLRVLIKRAEEEGDELEEYPRLPVEDAPGWLNGAWDRLFHAPSKQDVGSIHRIPTQRIVDDVLEGGDRSVEPSLESVAFKSARDELNLELAWQRLEIKTSMRNMSESSAVQDPSFDSEVVKTGSSAIAEPSGATPSSPPPMSPPHRRGSRNSSRNISRNTSGSRIPPSPPSGLKGRVGSIPAPRRTNPDVGKADALLAAFATIDAESEQVAEETVIDSSALRALAAAKRPNLLETLRRKFSQSGPPSEGLEDRVVDSDADGLYGGSSMLRRPGSGIRTGSATPDSMRMSPRSRMSPATSSLQRAHSSRASSSAGASTPAMISRQGSMHMDYFSRDYDLSDSGSEASSTEEAPVEEEEAGARNRQSATASAEKAGDQIARRSSGRESRISFEKSVWGGQRDLRDRSDETNSRFRASQSMRVAQVRSFEALEPAPALQSAYEEDSMDDSGRLPFIQPPAPVVLPEGTAVETHIGDGTRGAEYEEGRPESGSGGESSELVARMIGTWSGALGGSNRNGANSSLRTELSAEDEAVEDEAAEEESSSVSSLKQMWSELARRDGLRR